MSALLSRRGAISEGMPYLKIPSKDEIDAMSPARSASVEQEEDTRFSTAVSKVTPVDFWPDHNRVVRRGPVMRDMDGIAPLRQHPVGGIADTAPGIVSPTTVPETVSSLSRKRLADASPPQSPIADPTSTEESGKRQSTRLWNAAWLADNINWLAKDGEDGDKEILLLKT
ncbi:MAG: hypothetical protein Q9178_001656 [Gyalolechia marmorata]